MNTMTSSTHALRRNYLLRSPALRHGKGHGRAVSRWPLLAAVLMDTLLVGVAGLIAYHLRFSIHLFSLDPDFAREILDLPHGIAGVYFGFLLVYAALVVLVVHSREQYTVEAARSPLMSSLSIAWAITIATVLLTAFIYLSGTKAVSRLVVGFTAVASVVLLIGLRLGRSYLLRRRLALGIGLRHVVIIGAGKVGEMLAEYLQANPLLGYEVRGFLDPNHHGESHTLGKFEDLSRVAQQEFIDEVFITVPSERELVQKLALEATQLNLSVKLVSELYDGLPWQPPLEFVGDIPVRVLHSEPIPAFGLFLKRMTDVMVSATMLLILLPLLALTTVAIVMDSPGPVFYRGYRVGKKGRKFLCYKFRTMVRNADDLKDKLRVLNERDGPFFKIADDPRLTRMGRFLRKYSLDELPQLWNVFKGEMSLVGPRPHPLDDVQNYSLEHLRRLDVTPGITCLWQIDARSDPSFEKNVALDSKYIENWSYLLDLKILLRTIPVVLKGTGR